MPSPPPPRAPCPGRLASPASGRDRHCIRTAVDTLRGVAYSASAFRFKTPSASRSAPGMKLQALFRTKSVDRITRESETVVGHTLKRTLTSFDLTMLGIGAVIGTGIFAAIGTATAGNADRPGAGPAIMLSFILTAVA